MSHRPPNPAMRNGDMMSAWLRQAALEVESAHDVLDSFGVPRSISDDKAELTLGARITTFAERGLNADP